MPEYHRPASVEDAVAWLGRHAEEAVVVAGGTTIAPLLDGSGWIPAMLDLGAITALKHMGQDAEGLRVGATVTLADVEALAANGGGVPAFLAGVGHEIADPIIRQQATVGGNVVRGGELATALLALDGVVMVRSPAGERVQPLADTVAAGGASLLEPGELLTAVRVPAHRYRYLYYRKFTLSHLASIPLVSVAVSQRADTGAWRIAVGSLTLFPQRFPAAEQVGEGSGIGLPTGDGNIRRQVVEAVLAAVDAVDDERASAGYRRHLVAALLEDALVGEEGIKEAGGQ